MIAFSCAWRISLHMHHIHESEINYVPIFSVYIYSQSLSNINFVRPSNIITHSHPHRWSFVLIRNKKVCITFFYKKKYVLLSFTKLKEEERKKKQQTEIFHGKTYLAQARLITSKYSSPLEKTK